MQRFRTLASIALFAMCISSTSVFGLAAAADPDSKAGEVASATGNDNDLPKLAMASPDVALLPATSLISPTTPVISKAIPAAKPKINETNFQKKMWYTLAIANHSAVAFDSYSTRRAISHGARELNPTLRPFANSNSLYPVMQASAFGLDYLSHRMMRSKYSAIRKMWWLPQSANAVSSLFAGVNNMRR
jgi:hypothetical protein